MLIQLTRKTTQAKDMNNNNDFFQPQLGKVKSKYGTFSQIYCSGSEDLQTNSRCYTVKCVPDLYIYIKNKDKHRFFLFFMFYEVKKNLIKKTSDSLVFLKIFVVIICHNYRHKLVLFCKGK